MCAVASITNVFIAENTTKWQRSATVSNTLCRTSNCYLVLEG